jgi:hypothetical protein
MLELEFALLTTYYRCKIKATCDLLYDDGPWGSIHLVAGLLFSKFMMGLSPSDLRSLTQSWNGVVDLKHAMLAACYVGGRLLHGKRKHSTLNISVADITAAIPGVDGRILGLLEVHYLTTVLEYTKLTRYVVSAPWAVLLTLAMECDVDVDFEACAQLLHDIYLLTDVPLAHDTLSIARYIFQTVHQLDIHGDIHDTDRTLKAALDNALCSLRKDVDTGALKQADRKLAAFLKGESLPSASS